MELMTGGDLSYHLSIKKKFSLQETKYFIAWYVCVYVRYMSKYYVCVKTYTLIQAYLVSIYVFKLIVKFFHLFLSRWCVFRIRFQLCR